MYGRNHYIQNGLLKNFATKSSNGKFKICVIDLIEFNVKKRNTDSAFYEKNLYDVPNNKDIKELEKKFSEKIEMPIIELLRSINGTDMELTFSRKDLSIIKKYILLQLYRTPKNKLNYINPPKNSFELSTYNIQHNESNEDFWKREMLTILENDWDDLLRSDMIGVKKYAIEINSSFLMFVKTNQEFCLNDIGYVTERISMNIPKEKEKEYIQQSKDIGMKIFDVDNFDELAMKEIQNKDSYIDNYILFPISSKMAILCVDPIWKYSEMLKENGIPLFSPFLEKYLSLPKTDYVNKDKIKVEEDIPNYKTNEDKYTYIIHSITNDMTIYLNMLTINQAYRYIGLRTPQEFLETIKRYNILKDNGVENILHDLNGFVNLLSQVK